MPYVIPTILEQTQTGVRERITAVQSHFTRAQLDVLNNTTVIGSSYADPIFIEALRSGLVFEIDLMVDVDSYDLAQWNKEWVDKIIFHVEASQKPEQIIETIKAWNKKVFLSLNPETDIASVEPYLELVDGVMFLGVHPGKSGNPFLPSVLDTIQEFHAAHPEIEIEVDGGVNNETLPALLDVGATEFAAGSYLDNKNIEDRLFSLIGIIEGYEKKVSKH